MDKAKEIGMNIPMVTGDGVYGPTFISITGSPDNVHSRCRSLNGKPCDPRQNP